MNERISASKRRQFWRRFSFLPALVFAISCATTPHVSEVFDVEKLREIDSTIERAIADRKIPGAVLISTWFSKSWIPLRRNASRAVARYRVVRLGFRSKATSPNCTQMMPVSLRWSSASTIISTV